MDHNSVTSSDPWIHYMRKGEFGKAWEFSDKVLKAGLNRDYHHTPRHFQCIWNGTPLNGKKVLVRCYHGLGDTIQFIRYIPLLEKIAARVIVWAQPALISLLEQVEGIDQLLPLHDGIPEAEFDADVEIMELPYVFRSTLETIPDHVPYLTVDPKYSSTGRDRFSVGIVWQAGSWNQSRNVPFSLLKPWFQLKGISYYILQENAISAGWEDGFGIYPGDFDLYSYARVIAGLDLMITVDSMPAHLAGALNRPVWLMLSAEPDWRWMENRDDSPWYPSMRLFRQERAGEWEAVADKVKEQLGEIFDF